MSKILLSSNTGYPSLSLDNIYQKIKALL
jgi:hypothetical protein